MGGGGGLLREGGQAPLLLSPGYGLAIDFTRCKFNRQISLLLFPLDFEENDIKIYLSVP